MKNLLPLISLPALLVLFACSGDQAPDASEEPATPSAGSEPVVPVHPLEPYYLAEAPAGAIEVAALRELEDGAKVTVRGDVQEFAPVSGKAVLSLYDHALLSCDEIPGDQCETPWDFCCVPDDEIAKAKALVEFRDDGKLVAADLGGFHGIDHLSDVIVTGTLRLDDAGNARIEATGLHVE